MIGHMSKRENHPEAAIDARLTTRLSVSVVHGSS